MHYLAGGLVTDYARSMRVSKSGFQSLKSQIENPLVKELQRLGNIQLIISYHGAATKGSNDDTIDGFSEKKILKIIKMLRDGTFQPTPVRRPKL